MTCVPGSVEARSKLHCKQWPGRGQSTLLALANAITRLQCKPSNLLIQAHYDDVSLINNVDQRRSKSNLHRGPPPVEARQPRPALPPLPGSGQPRRPHGCVARRRTRKAAPLIMERFSQNSARCSVDEILQLHDTNTLEHSRTPRECTDMSKKTKDRMRDPML